MINTQDNIKKFEKLYNKCILPHNDTNKLFEFIHKSNFYTIKEIIRQLMEHGGFSYLMSIVNKLPNDTERKICCLGCNHFFYWNNGSAGCDLDKQYICTHNSFILREEEDDRKTEETI